jgi:hypothetical protein
MSISFDGNTKRIIITSPTTTVSVKNDIYSAWKEWVLISDNSKYPQALRSIGGDPVGGGQYAGDIYFLMNNWQIELDTIIKVTGTLFHDNGIEPFIVNSGGGVTSTVSNLAYAYNTTGGSIAPTVLEIRNELDNNSVKLAEIVDKLNNITLYVDQLESRLTATRASNLDNIDIPTSGIWDMPVSQNPVEGSMGEWVSRKLLSVVKYIGLK